MGLLSWPDNWVDRSSSGLHCQWWLSLACHNINAVAHYLHMYIASGACDASI